MAVCIAARVAVAGRWRSELATRFARFAFGKMTAEDDHDADEVRGGPNGTLSLTQARRELLEVRSFRCSMLTECSEASAR